MAKTNAERMKKYREKLKKDSVKYEAAKAKARARNNSIRAKLSGTSLEAFRNKVKLRQKKCRENKTKRLTNISSSAFKSRQSFVVVQHLAEKFGLIPKPKHQRTSLQLADNIKDDVQDFYLRDDISYQLPGKRDTVVVKDDDGSKLTYQKRILLNNLRETYELFKEENSNVDIGRSSFAELRPAFVITTASLAHRNCLCLYHENICLILKAVDKYVDGKYCSSLKTFTDCLVCSTTNEECMFCCCLLCKDFFSEKIEENVGNGDSKIIWSQWINEAGRAQKKEFSGTVDEAIVLLKSKVEYFLFHVYITREQSKFF